VTQLAERTEVVKLAQTEFPETRSTPEGVARLIDAHGARRVGLVINLAIARKRAKRKVDGFIWVVDKLRFWGQDHQTEAGVADEIAWTNAASIKTTIEPTVVEKLPPTGRAEVKELLAITRPRHAAQ
jgi:hypothetical protein